MKDNTRSLYIAAMMTVIAVAGGLIIHTLAAFLQYTRNGDTPVIDPIVWWVDQLPWTVFLVLSLLAGAMFIRMAVQLGSELATPKS